MSNDISIPLETRSQGRQRGRGGQPGQDAAGRTEREYAGLVSRALGEDAGPGPGHGYSVTSNEWLFGFEADLVLRVSAESLAASPAVVAAAVVGPLEQPGPVEGSADAWSAGDQQGTEVTACCGFAHNIPLDIIES